MSKVFPDFVGAYGNRNDFILGSFLAHDSLLQQLFWIGNVKSVFDKFGLGCCIFISEHAADFEVNLVEFWTIL